MIYEYVPKSKRKQEKILLLAMITAAVLLFAASRLPGIPFPFLFQLFSIFCLVVVIMLTARCLLRSYVYRIEQGEDGTGEDLVIVEYYGNHVATVCRLALTDIRRVVRRDSQTRTALVESMKGKRLYRYTEEFSPADLCVLEADDEGETVFLRISADETLFRILCAKGQQKLS